MFYGKLQDKNRMVCEHDPGNYYIDNGGEINKDCSLCGLNLEKHPIPYNQKFMEDLVDLVNKYYDKVSINRKTS
jgi:hypothetical protein